MGQCIVKEDFENFSDNQLDKNAMFKLVEERFYEKFDADIRGHILKIQTNLDKFSEERSYIRNRICEIARKEFNTDRVNVKPFGSLVTGLAVESSDLDVAITGLDISTRE